MKIIVRGCLIDQMKRRDALITIKEYFISLQYIVAEKNQENPKEYHFFKKNTVFSGSDWLAGWLAV